MLPTARKLAFTDVPVIDLAPAWSGDSVARRALADEIAEACGTVGFMYVKNRRVADADLRDRRGACLQSERDDRLRPDGHGLGE